LILLKEFLFNCDVVIGNTQYDHAVLRLSGLRSKSTFVFIITLRFCTSLGDKFILDQN